MEMRVKLDSHTAQQSYCPVCSSKSLQNILEVQHQPLLVNVLWENRDHAVDVRRASLNLTFCDTCGHTFNRSFDPAQMDYNLPYENSLHFSPRFQTYATWLAYYLVKKYNLHGKAIIEIGSGKGDFLQMLCELGGNVGTGFDPSYEAMPGDKPLSISLIKDTYSERYADHQADLILSRHVLEHIYQPAEFMQSIRDTIGTNKRTSVFFEVPNFSYILKETAIWDLIYEHYSYFSPQSLARLLTRSDFNVINLGHGFDNQFLYIEAIPRDKHHSPPNEPIAQPVSELASQVSEFALASQQKLHHWSTKVQQMASENKRVVIWGAGSKGISFLNMLNVHDEIEYVIDINPRKRDMYITGTGQQIVPPDFLKEYRPDVVIIMNPIYAQEIKNTVEQLGLEVEYSFAS